MNNIVKNRSLDVLEIIDDKTINLVGSSLKDHGRKCFPFTQLDSSEIQNLKASPQLRSGERHSHDVKMD